MMILLHNQGSSLYTTQKSYIASQHWITMRYFSQSLMQRLMHLYLMDVTLPVV